MSNVACEVSTGLEHEPRTNEEITFRVPELQLKDTQEQIDYLILAWNLLLYRENKASPKSDYFWSYGDPVETLKSITATYSIPRINIIQDDSISISSVLDEIRSIRRSRSALSFQNYHIILNKGDSTSKSMETFGMKVAVTAESLRLRIFLHPSVPSYDLSPLHLHTYVDILDSVLFDTSQTAAQATRLGKNELAAIWHLNKDFPPTLTTCMHSIISGRSYAHPDRPAICSWDGQLTYGELEDISSKFAFHLISLGVQVGTIIPLCFEKSIWTVVALLAIMKSGAGFSLTDPAQPESRLQIIVSEVDAKVVLVSEKNATLGRRIATNAEVVLVGPKMLQSLDSMVQSGKTLPTVPGSSILYVIFTSGSTGKPKGVVITHENYTSGAIPRAKAVGYHSQSRVLDFASYAFDVSIDCMLATLSQGGCVCVPSVEQRLNDLGGAIKTLNVNMAHMTPSVARVLESGVMEMLEVIGLGGEKIGSSDAADWGQKTKVIIAYGPSECTVGCTINNDVGEGKTSIGKGVGGLTWIVDPDDHNILTPIGGIGELIIEGPVVGMGYLNEPEKTSAVFIQDPVWLTAGCSKTTGRRGRLYKTGDLVRYDPDGSGNICFVGRKDQQVKLRGQRVELGEIEYHMRKHLPNNTNLVAEVITTSGHGSEPALVAFVVESSINSSDIRSTKLSSFSSTFKARLKTMEKAINIHLPVYMIPTAYIPLSKLPLLISNKIDRKELRALGSGFTKQQLSNYRAGAVERRELKTDNEKRIHALWVRLFGNDIDIGGHDNFFALGGDSLKAMKLVTFARLEGLSLTVADIFTYPSLFKLALAVKQVKTDSAADHIPAFDLLPKGWSKESAREEVGKLCNLELANIEDVFPCTPLQEGFMALSAKISEAYIAQRVVELPDLETAQKLQKAFEMVVADCSILRTRILQVPGRGLVQTIVHEQITWRKNDSLEDYLVTDRAEGMGLTDALVRFALVEDNQTSKVFLVLTVHHALYDGWSMPLIIDRVNRAYRGIDIGQSTPFNAFLGYLGRVDRATSETYWKQELDGANGVQFPALPEKGYQQQADSLLEHYVRISRAPDSKATTTAATAIRGAWAFVVSRYIGSNDVVFGETLTGRNAPIPGIETIEGPMITTVPVRIQIDPNSSSSEYLQQIHDQSVSRFPHEHLGLQNIRRLSPDAREACQLRTGLILQPNPEEQEVATSKDQDPANGFLPAGDADAAREALRFNSYGLMLVCSLDNDGILIMASFDKQMVGVAQMEKMLEQFGSAIRQLFEKDFARIGDIELLQEREIPELRSLSVSGAHKLNAERNTLSETFPEVVGTWIADLSNPDRLVSKNAVGELLVESSAHFALSPMKNPSWFVLDDTDSQRKATHLYTTGQLARYDNGGFLVLLGGKDEIGKLAKKPSIRQELKKILPATSPRQQRLIGLWSRVLNIAQDEISIDDNFFELGGDSIGAMKLVSEARMERLELTMAKVFRNKLLYEMESVMQDLGSADGTDEPKLYTPFSTLDVGDIGAFISETIQPSLLRQDWKVSDIYPARPLQEIAVRGTSELPRFSARYELFFLDAAIDRKKLFKSCQELVNRNEILRTVFIRTEEECFGVVIDHIDLPLEQYEIETGLEHYSHQLGDLDVETDMPLGSPYLKFLFVQEASGSSCLILRISHAQYDEICLPLMLHQLSALYEERLIPATAPFSQYVHHVVKKNIPESVAYWRDLLAGSSLSILEPTFRTLESPKAGYVDKTFDISARSRDITVATLPTAAWALVLARRLKTRDVTFGEVVSGRNFEFQNSDPILGPCWQYVPARIKFTPGMTAGDLLHTVQEQHINTSRFEGIGFQEIVKMCTDWDKRTDWFDSVVHQDVEHVESMTFLSANSKMETIYPHPEPLREWKLQCYPNGDKIHFEVVTWEPFLDVATELLEEMGTVLRLLTEQPDSILFE